MTAAASDTLAALLEAIRAEPDDDTVRLALADFLEESGTDPARAEFVRVQVEISRFTELCGASPPDQPSPNCDCVGCNLRRRESSLLAEHEARWRRGEPCSEDCAHSPRKNGLRQVYESAGPDSRWVVCHTCRGTGWERWWLSERTRIADRSDHSEDMGWRRRVHFERGFPAQVDANLRDIMDERGNPTEWALAVVRSEPGMRRFGVVDRQPRRIGKLWAFDCSVAIYASGVRGDRFERSALPDGIHRLLKQHPGHAHGYFPSESAANRALGEASYQCVKEQAESGS